LSEKDSIVIAIVVYVFVLEGNGSRGFGNYVLLGVGYEGYKGSLAIEFVGAELGESRQGRVRRDSCFALAGTMTLVRMEVPSSASAYDCIEASQALTSAIPAPALSL
jgi:hypothetical protein